MFRVQQMSKPNDSGIRQIQIVDAEWNYRDDVLNWTRAISFLPLWSDAITWVRVDELGDVVISYGRR